MATSGWARATVTAYDYIQFNWEITSQSVADNTSTVSWNVQLVAKTNGALIAVATQPYKVYVDGKSYQGGFVPSIADNTTITIAKGTTVVPHNTDGTKKMYYSGTFSFEGIYFSGKNIGVIAIEDAYGNLDDIPRQAKITSAPNFTDEDSPVISYSNPAGTKADKVMACISFDKTKDNIPYRDISKTGSTYQFVFTDAERQTFYNAMSDKTSMTVYFYIRTTLGTTNYYSMLAKTLTLTDIEPVLVPTVYDKNPITIQLTGNSAKLVKGYSYADYNFNAYAQKGATLVSRQVVNGSQTKTTESGTFDRVEDSKFVFTIKDSRGKTGTNTIDRKAGWIDYVPLTCDVSTVSTSAQGSITFRVKGNYFNGTFGATTNFLGMLYKLQDKTAGTVVKTETINLTASGNSYSKELTFTGLDYEHEYTLEATVADALLTVKRTYSTKIQPVFDWSAADFSFNVPVSIQGSLLQDYVVEQGSAAMGTNGTWYWTKWKSGKAECWGTRNYGNMSISNAWGSGYFSGSFTQAFPTGLFSAIDYVSIQPFGAGDTSNYWICKQGVASAANSGSFAVMRNSSGTVSQVYISFHAIGRWK